MSLPFSFIETLRQGYRLRCPARGDSMLPAIRAGDLLTVTPGHFWDLRTGDIAVYASPSSPEVLTTHRIMEIHWEKDRPYAGMRSDSEGWRGSGERVFPEQIFGRVTLIEKGRRMRRLKGLRREWD